MYKIIIILGNNKSKTLFCYGTVKSLYVCIHKDIINTDNYSTIKYGIKLSLKSLPWVAFNELYKFKYQNNLNICNHSYKNISIFPNLRLCKCHIPCVLNSIEKCRKMIEIWSSRNSQRLLSTWFVGNSINKPHKIKCSLEGREELISCYTVSCNYWFIYNCSANQFSQ